MKKKVFNTIVILCIVALSLIGGVIYAETAKNRQKKEYPDAYRGKVRSAAVEFGIPKAAVSAVLHTASGFDATLEDDGDIGLFRLSESEYIRLAQAIDESRDTRLRWSPDVSIRLCAYALSECFSAFSDRTAAFAALYSSKEAVSRNIESNDGKFVLSKMEASVRDRTERTEEAYQKYLELYPETNLNGEEP